MRNPSNYCGETSLSEAAIALCINGVCQAVMMASANDLKAFALGFFISEAIIDGLEDVLSTDCEKQPNGWLVNVTVLAACEHRLKIRRRTMAGPSGCGLCGIDSLAAAMSSKESDKAIDRPQASLPSAQVIAAAKQSLNFEQKRLGHARGHHSAALFNNEANPLLISQDVGRHSALDKLIGQASLSAQPLTEGFVMITSRCSHDLISKCASASIDVFVSLAAPTDLAVQTASDLGITLLCFQDSHFKRFA